MCVDHLVPENSLFFMFICLHDREEGLLCGGSCGSVMVGALEAARSLKKGQRCVGEAAQYKRMS